MSKTQLTSENAVTTLDKLYTAVIQGIPGISKPIEQFAEDYLLKNKDVKSAVNSMIKNQLIKCTTTGIATGFGGLLTLPVTLPADLSSSLYMQMRMIACTAHMNGYDIHSDQVKTLVYACLVGLSAGNVVKQFGVKAGVQFAKAGIKKIPGKILTKINQKVGFRFLTKFGTKGLVNIGKLIPIVGAGISGGLNYAETKIIAKRAYKNFVEGDFSEGEKIDITLAETNDGEVIDTEIVEE